MFALVAMMAPVFGAVSLLPLDPSQLDRIRYLSLPVILTELLVLAYCLRHRGLLFATAARLPKFVQIGLALWTAVAVLSASNAEGSRPTAVYFTFCAVTHVAFGLAVFSLFEGPWRSRQAAFLKMMMAGMAACFALLVAYVAIRGGEPGFSWLALGFLGNNVRHVGYFSAAGAALALGWFAAEGRSFPRWPGLILAVLMASVGYWSGTRFMLAGLIGSAILACLIFRGSSLRRLSFGLIFTLIAAIPISLLHQPPWGSYGFWRIIGTSAGGNAAAGFSNNRWDLWLRTADQIRQNPWIGHGEAQLPYLHITPQFIETHPHNVALQFMFHYGVAGGLLALILLTWGVLAAHRNAVRQPSLGLPAWMGLVSLLLISLIDGSLYWPYPTAMCALLLGYLISLEGPELSIRPGQEPDDPRRAQ